MTSFPVTLERKTLRFEKIILGLLCFSVCVAALLGCVPAAPTPSPAVGRAFPFSATLAAMLFEVKHRYASLEVVNHSGGDIGGVYLVPPLAAERGQNWLAGVLIAPQDHLVINDILKGTYDIIVEDLAGHVIKSMPAVELKAVMRYTVGPVATSEIVNNSPVAIHGVYLAPARSDVGQTEYLAGDAIEPGASYVLYGLPPGAYDIRFVDVEGVTVEALYNLYVAGRQTWTLRGKTNVPAAARLRYEDTFSDARGGWGQELESDTVYYQPPSAGEYCLFLKKANLTAWEWYEAFEADRFVAELACAVEQEGGDAGCGLGFGSDGGNLYWFEISPERQSFALFLMQEQVWQAPLIEWTSSKHIAPYGWNYLSLERVDGQLSVLVNGVLLGQVAGELFPRGFIALGGASYASDSATIRLDNLRVWSFPE